VKAFQDKAVNTKADMKTTDEKQIANMRAAYDERVKKLQEVFR
jgi:hypothetical protein